MFVAILGYNQHTYVEAMAYKKRVPAPPCENAQRYFGGGEAIAPDDNCSAVTRGSRFEAVLNDEFAASTEQYATSTIPTYPYKPREKSLVEGGRQARLQDYL